MIRNETDYKNAVERIEAEKARIAETQAILEAKGLNAEEVKRVIDPILSFHLQLREEVESYEKLKRGEFEQLKNLNGLGHLLICLRIAQGLTQKELAELLEVKPSQVSRDERNEYHGITAERANKILNALGAELYSTVEVHKIAA